MHCTCFHNCCQSPWQLPFKPPKGLTAVCFSSFYFFLFSCSHAPECLRVIMLFSSGLMKRQNAVNAYGWRCQNLIAYFYHTKAKNRAWQAGSSSKEPEKHIQQGTVCTQVQHFLPTYQAILINDQTNCADTLFKLFPVCELLLPAPFTCPARVWIIKILWNRTNNSISQTQHVR